MTLPLVENILAQPEAIRTAAAHQFGEGKDALLRSSALLRSNRRLILSGMGGSLAACIPLTHYLASKGLLVPAIETSELLYSGAAAIDEDTAVILVSRSGETVEVTKLLPVLKEQKATVIGVTNVSDSTLASNATQSVCLHSPPDQLVAIQTYTATLTVLLLLGTALSNEFDAKLRSELDAAVHVLSNWIPECFKLSDGWSSFLQSASPLYLLGRGPSLASVAEGVLLIHEVAKAPAVGMSAADFRHGPVEVVDTRFHGIIFGSERKTADLNAALADDLSAMNADVRWIGPPVADHKTVSLCPWPRNAPDRFASLLEIIPMQIAAYRMAKSRGIVAGEFRHAPAITLSETGFGAPQNQAPSAGPPHPNDMCILCADIGGTSTKAGVVNSIGELTLLDSIPTRGPDASSFTDALCNLLDRIRQTAVAQQHQLAGLAVAIAGFLNPDRSRMVYNANLPWLENYPIRDHLIKRFGMRVELEVDSNAACMAEYCFGAGRGSRRFLCLAAGTGLGGGMAIDGHPLRFAYECLGDIGHVIVQPDGPVCTCGGRGCAEILISAPVLADRYREKRGLRSKVSLRDVISAAKAGDDLAVSIVEQAGEWLGIAAASIANILLPDRIAIAGGLSASGDLLLKPAERAFRSSASEFARSQAAFCLAALGPMATLAGAAWPFLAERAAVRTA